MINHNAQDAKGLAIILTSSSPKDFSFSVGKKKDGTRKNKLPYNFAGTHQFGEVWDTSIIFEKVHKTKVNYSLCRTLFTSNICLGVLALTIFTSKY